MQSLGGLGARETAPRILDLLRKGDDDTRSAAIEALAELGFEPAVPDIAALLGSEPGYVRRIAACALGRLKATQAVPTLEKLLDDPEGDVREAAALTLCALGQGKGVPIILGKGEHLCPLNALRRPETWKALGAKPVASWPKDGPIDLSAITEAAGLPLDFSAAPDAREERWHFFPWNANAPRTALGLIEGMWSDDFEIILERQGVKLLSRHDAVEFWSEWWATEEKKGK
jgi:hypothetical protein